MSMEFPADQLLTLLESAKQVASIALNLTAVELYGNIVRETPVDHGRLQGSWQIDQIDELSYRIYTNVEYALAVHDGARPHDIWPKGISSGSDLSYLDPYSHITGMQTGSGTRALYWSGALHPYRHVHHPGYRGNPFTEPAIASTEDRLDEFVQTALEQTGVAS